MTHGQHAPVSVPFPPPTPPTPRLTITNQSHNGAGWTTAIARQHPPGTGFCGKCPREECTQVFDVCLVSVKEFVADEDGPSFSTVGRTFEGPGVDLRLRAGDGAGAAG